ncbi:MAG: hypothetical protein NTX02_01200, partial [Planctomycetia bacterium]|nr:hypothetical protein [Planctomycetia bacterium]
TSLRIRDGVISGDATHGQMPQTTTHHSLVFTRTIICVPAINVCDIKYFLTIFAAGITERAPLAAPSIGEIRENGLRSTVGGGSVWDTVTIAIDINLNNRFEYR